MTSDGITKKDWAKIHKLAVKIVNAAAVEDEVLADLCTGELLGALDFLEKKYGALPSILATRADYVSGDRHRQKLLGEAFDKAVQIQDRKNQISVASSLAEHFADRKQMKSAYKWLVVGQKLLEEKSDKYESQNLREVAEKIGAHGKGTARIIPRFR